MPELPEVETTRRGITAHTTGATVTCVQVYQPRLRWMVHPKLAEYMQGQVIHRVSRRAKYLLLEAQNGTLMLHLGMSGRLRLLPCDTVKTKHDHVDIDIRTPQNEAWRLRLHDPRKFGAALWVGADEYPAVEAHPLLAKLGPEPLEATFTPHTLITAAHNKQVAIKQLIMNAHVVVGVGNIYASEALFRARIAPTCAAGLVTTAQHILLHQAIVDVLTAAVAAGGTTLRDYVGADGGTGYFQQTLNVYGREGLPCTACAAPIVRITQQNRSSFYCAQCQP